MKQDEINIIYNLYQYQISLIILTAVQNMMDKIKQIISNGRSNREPRYFIKTQQQNQINQRVEESTTDINETNLFNENNNQFIEGQDDAFNSYIRIICFALLFILLVIFAIIWISNVPQQHLKLPIQEDQTSKQLYKITVKEQSSKPIHKPNINSPINSLINKQPSEKYQREIIQKKDLNLENKAVMSQMILKQQNKQLSQELNTKKKQVIVTLPEQQQLQKLLKEIKLFRAPHLKIKTPELYLDTFKVTESRQLPFCIVSRNINEQAELQKIMGSLNRQNYSNYHVVYSGSKKVENIANATYIDVDSQKLEILAIKQMSKLGCNKKSIIVLVRTILKQNVLRQLNLIYQRENIWLTYQSQKDSRISSVNSFYYQVLVQITETAVNDNNPSNYQKAQLQKFASSIVRLCRYHAQAYPISLFYQQQPKQDGIQFFYGKISTTVKKYIQSPMMYFDPNYQTQKQVNTLINKLNTTNPPQNKYKPRNLITLSRMMKALEYYSLKDLPQNHTLADRQIIQYQQKYKLSNYPVQKPLCVIILSRNNIDGRRYQRVLQSIQMQNYTNYHIVFIDDASTDATYQESEKYLQKINLLNKTKMIKNDRQMFGTYNIQNAVHNYCNSGEVTVLMDGDDQFLGKQVFKLINFGYQQKQNWIVYFTFFSTDYMYGVSQVPQAKFFQTEGPREQNKIIGALRTFYVDIYRKINMKDHQDDDGDFFDRLYDDAMQYPLLQMSGIQHTRYIPEVVYFYNQNYGHNDGSTQEGRDDWKKHEKQVLARPKYMPLQKLNN